MWRGVVWCGTMWCGVVWCAAVCRGAMCCGVARYGAVRACCAVMSSVCCMLRYEVSRRTSLCYVVLHCMVLCRAESCRMCMVRGALSVICVACCLCGVPCVICYVSCVHMLFII